MELLVRSGTRVRRRGCRLKVVVKGEWDTPHARLGAAEKILAELGQAGWKSVYEEGLA